MVKVRVIDCSDNAQSTGQVDSKMFKYTHALLPVH